MEQFLVHLIVLSSYIVGYFSTENWPRSTSKQPRLERVLEGKDVALRCAGRNDNATAFWEYKPCGNSFNMSSCSSLSPDKPVIGDSTSWSPLEEARAVLVIKEAKMSQAGLYRCQQSANPIISVKSTVQLEVYNKYTEDDFDFPRFLEGLPKNLTVQKDMQAVFQCKVLSRSPPSIRWVVQDSRGSAGGAVRYLQHWYAPVQPAGERTLPGDVHLSKMVIPRARSIDSGRYFCVAVNTRGFTNSSAYLQVLGDDDENLLKSQPRTWSLYLLFLLPVGLALVPLSLWLWFSWRRTSTEQVFGDVSLQDAMAAQELKQTECCESEHRIWRYS